ncbi:unnamed protein product [Ostreobium quekettii]|uniref:MRG domain-containing protein n=1 Tax=Ostreobium quekettii TaxID=121088 RepID=A0A8S1IXA1_9CHLO|nr:unnamed protein product [Ostreobium quekettii]
MAAVGDRQQFAIGERVLVPHLDKPYEAKVLKAEFRDESGWYFFVHYTGWNKKYDEWVEDSGLQKMSQRESPPPGRRSSWMKVGADAHGKLAKKRKADEMMGNTSTMVEVELPPTLKKQLVDEYEVVVQQGRTVPLPRSPPVMELLRQFVHYGGSNKASQQDLQQLATGIEEYFDKALGSYLLYGMEQDESDKLTGAGTCASAVYGAEHLLRLLVKLPSLLLPTPLSPSQTAVLNNRLHLLVHFLNVRRNDLFARFSEYRSKQPSPPSQQASGVQGGVESGHSGDVAVGV